MSVVYLLLGTSSRELDKDRREDVFDDELKVAMDSVLIVHTCYRSRPAEELSQGDRNRTLCQVANSAVITLYVDNY